MLDVQSLLYKSTRAKPKDPNKISLRSGKIRQDINANSITGSMHRHTQFEECVPRISHNETHPSPCFFCVCSPYLGAGQEYTFRCLH